MYDEEVCLVLLDLLTEKDIVPARDAMLDKVEEIVAQLEANSTVANTFEDTPFEDAYSRGSLTGSFWYPKAKARMELA